MLRCGMALKVRCAQGVGEKGTGLFMKKKHKLPDTGFLKYQTYASNQIIVKITTTEL
jgi:hypothetical protein